MAGGVVVVLDTVNATVGFRTTAFTGLEGTPPFALNGHPMHAKDRRHKQRARGIVLVLPAHLHVLVQCTPMWALGTCRRANESELPATHQSFIE